MLPFLWKCSLLWDSPCSLHTIAPISSWAAAVGSSLPESSTLDGFSLFLKTIPLNLYALLTLAFLIWLMAADFDFGPMKKYELAHNRSNTLFAHIAQPACE